MLCTFKGHSRNASGAERRTKAGPEATNLQGL